MTSTRESGAGLATPPGTPETVPGHCRSCVGSRLSADSIPRPPRPMSPVPVIVPPSPLHTSRWPQLLPRHPSFQGREGGRRFPGERHLRAATGSACPLPSPHCCLGAPAGKGGGGSRWAVVRCGHEDRGRAGNRQSGTSEAKLTHVCGSGAPAPGWRREQGLTGQVRRKWAEHSEQRLCLSSFRNCS